MLHTFEMRWFFDDRPLSPDAHFDTTTTLQRRTDWYSMPCNPKCGIKLREGRFESKLLDECCGVREFGPMTGILESWKKWSLELPRHAEPTEEDLARVDWIAVEKERYLQRYTVDGETVTECDQRPLNGCEFEMTTLFVRDKTVWTVGFEAVGQQENLEVNLRHVAEFVQQRGGLSGKFTQENSFGYAEWLSRMPTS